MRWISYLNVAFVIAIAAVGGLFFFHLMDKKEPLKLSPHLELTELPKSSFALYDQELEVGPFALNWVAPEMQLPDLTEELLFFGANQRPDAQHTQAFHIGLKSSGTSRTLSPGERLYLLYEGGYHAPLPPEAGPLWGDASEMGTYTFSPDNAPTPLWVEPSAVNPQQLVMQVTMLDEKGALVQTPSSLHQIALPRQPLPQMERGNWELGGFRVDSTLLVRQKGRWMGSDRFLELHGGEEFGHIAGLQRVEFMDGESPYSCYIGSGHFLIWKENRWRTPLPGDSTAGYPLLSVRKIDDKILALDLWDAEGMSKTPLNLIRARERSSATPNLAQELKFVGAKTWAQFIVEARSGARLTLKPNDWMILTQDGWKKLDSPEEIDAYVEGTLTGPLFILDKLTKQNGRQVLVGHLFNALRTDVEEVELEAASTSSIANYCRTIPVEPPIKTHIEGDAE